VRVCFFALIKYCAIRCAEGTIGFITGRKAFEEKRGKKEHFSQKKELEKVL